MDRRSLCFSLLFLLPGVLLAGCQSPYHSDQGALTGGLLGAGTGALVGSALGHTGAGAAIGAGVGALSGAAVGSELDNIEARNRAMIEQQLGRQIAATAVTINDVINMSRAGVNEELIVNHVRAHGVAAPLQAGDLIVLQQQGVSPRVIATMQATPMPQPAPVVYQAAPPPVIVEEYDPWGPPWRCGHYYRRPSMRWGVSIH